MLLAERTAQQPHPLVGAPADERAARRTLRTQIARLERDLGAAFVEAGGRLTPAPVARRSGGARLLSLAELERVRDALAARLADVRAEQAERADRYQAYRTLIEQMLLEPERHKWARVRGTDIGEIRCKSWHVRPRWGPIGLLCNWWRVKISLGCPLPGGRLTVSRRA